MIASASWILPAQPAAADVLDDVQGVWGLELFEDMNCAMNPVHITYLEGAAQLDFQWPKTVDYSDGTSADAVTFTVVKARKNTLVLKRDRDGVSATITLAADNKSFRYEEDGPGEGSRFDRCANASG